jgi:lipoate-protein ligase A
MGDKALGTIAAEVSKPVAGLGTCAAFESAELVDDIQGAESRETATSPLDRNESPTWYLLRCPARPAAENMALDEVLLEASSQLSQPVLRFYHWSEPAASFGYFQKFSEVERMTKLRPLVRRPTGGGLVPHDSDWTYSLLFPPASSWYGLKAAESYCRLHEWVQAAFQRIGLNVRLSQGSAKQLPGQCFAGPEKSDVVWSGRKIAGAAQRRTRQGLLIQGSIQCELQLTRAVWEEAFCDVAREQWRIKWVPFELTSELEKSVQRLTSEKYLIENYLKRR